MSTPRVPRDPTIVDGPPDGPSPWMHRLLLAIVALLVAGGVVTIAITDDDGDGRRDRVVIDIGPRVATKTTVRTDATDPDQQTTVTAPPEAIMQAGEGVHQGLRTENPPGVTAEQLDAKREAEERLAADDQLPLVQPDAAPEQRGCVTRLVGNYSTRRGVRPRLFVVHYTVSPNRPGWDDVNAVVNLFNTFSFQASSNYVIDREGNCAYIVRESDKAWTQAAANPFAISVEIINTGREPNLIDGPGLKKLGQVISDSTKRWDIPLRQGAVNGCAPARAGIVTHQMLGACGGGHVDVSPYPLAPIIKAATKARGPAITARDRTDCRYVRATRQARKRGVPVSVHRKKLHKQRLERLAKRGLTCKQGLPVRR